MCRDTLQSMSWDWTSKERTRTWAPGFIRERKRPDELEGQSGFILVSRMGDQLRDL